MLILTRKSGQAIRVGEATVTIVKRRGQSFTVLVDAPPHVPIVRAELVERRAEGGELRAEGGESDSTPSALRSLPSALRSPPSALCSSPEAT